MKIFNLTKELNMEGAWIKRYAIARSILFALFIAAAIALAYALFFPSMTFDYFFNLNPDSLKNTVSTPRDASDMPIKSGQISGDGKFIFDTLVTGNFSDATMNYTLDKNSAALPKTNLTVRRSYHSFFYPVGGPMGFRNGNLLSNAGNFYIVSDNLLRKFATPEVMQAMGFRQEMFIPITDTERSLNKPGLDVSDPTQFPAGTLIKVDDNYYQFGDGNSLDHFISANAYLSRYRDAQAIVKDKTFLEANHVSQTEIGFADGTLAAYGQSVYILSGGKYFPINNPQTFEILGLNWNDVIPVTPDELAIYKKQKIFTQNNPHPDGIIFQDVKTNAYFIVENAQKHLLNGADLINSYLRNHPVVVDSDSLNITAQCTLSKSIWPLRSYSCTVPLAKIKDLPGNDYQFSQTTTNPFQITQLDVTFHTSLNWQNMKDSLSHIKKSISATYAPPQ